MGSLEQKSNMILDFKRRELRADLEGSRGSREPWEKGTRDSGDKEAGRRGMVLADADTVFPFIKARTSSFSFFSYKTFF